MSTGRSHGSEPGAPLRLRTFGGAGLFAGDGAEPLLGPGKPFALLTYLALTPGRRTSREALIDLLWADVDPERARSSLRQALFHLRRLFGEEAISGTEELSLSRPVDADRNSFLSHVERGELEGAIEQYRGPFLPAFGVPGGAAFEQWADLERDRLQALFLRTAELLVRRRLNQSQFREAQRLARQVRELAPSAELPWRLVLEAAVAGRDFVAAAAEADAVEQWAAAEGVFLEPPTRAAMARARRLVPADGEGREGATLVAELTGREREFSAITSAWESARAGSARHLHLTAPAGLGKTRLLRDATARLAATGVRVVRVQGTPGDREVPFAFAGDLAAAIAALPGAASVAPASASTLVALNPALSARFTAPVDGSGGEEALRRRILALADLVHSVAHEGPFVLAIDDLHWVDPPSYRLLEGLWSRLEGAHVLLLTASRPERAPVGSGITPLPLSALTPLQAGSLVSALGALPAGEPWTTGLVPRLFEATGGSPLLLLETLRLALDRGVLSLDQDGWRCADPEQLVSLLQRGEALRERIRALPRSPGWILALLATAGTPLEAEALAAVAGQTGAELSAGLLPLEHQGLVGRTPLGWMPAHDELAAAAREGLSPEESAAAERAVGEWFAGSAGDDPQRLLRAARHLVAAGAAPELERLFRRYSLIARQQGDRRPFTQLGREFLGQDAGSAGVAHLVGRLPRHWRLGLWSGARLAAAVAVFILGPALLAGTLAARHASEASLQRLVILDSLRMVSTIPVRAAAWDGTTDAAALTRGSSSMADAALGHPELPPAISPDGRSVAWIQDAGDSTTLDIWLRTPAGTRRLTRQWRDDLVYEWLPDGSGLVGTTNRWSPPRAGDYDIAIFDTATGGARQVTRGTDYDTNPHVSPDGTRIAFGRVGAANPPMICVTTIDGRREPECRLVAGLPPSQLVGWTGLNELAVVLQAPDSRPLVRYDWARNTVAPVLGPHVSYGAWLSPDHRWIVAPLRLDGIRGTRVWIVPLEHPGNARPVEGEGRLSGTIRWWEGPPDLSSLVDRLEFTDSTALLQPGIGTLLRVRPLTASGREVPVLAPVEWATSDSTVAVVDTTGEVHVRAPGRVVISASLGGWRTARRGFTIGGAAASTVVSEEWDESWRSRWIRWGDPAPVVVAGPGGVRGFWSHGDGSYPSMALLRQGFAARQGLGVEVRLSTPVSRTQWQRMRIALLAGLDTAALLRADQRGSPGALERAEASCSAIFPGEGGWGATRIGLLGGISHDLDLGEASHALRTGAWWTLRLQILPDGRCGLAINGRPIWLSPEPISLDGEFRLRIGDESADTRLLHGPLQLWTGVRTDIDWSAIRP